MSRLTLTTTLWDESKTPNYALLMPVTEFEYKKILNGATALLREKYPQRPDAYPMTLYILSRKTNKALKAKVESIFPARAFPVADRLGMSEEMVKQNFLSGKEFAFLFTTPEETNLGFKDFLVLNARRHRFERIFHLPDVWKYVVLKQGKELIYYE